MNQPFPKSWWVRDKQFLAGCFPGTEMTNGTRERLENLVAAGIRTFISLQPEDERNSRTGVAFPHYEPMLAELERQTGNPLQFYRLGVPDLTAPTSDITTKALDIIDGSLASGNPVYLHCWGGHGRTGTIVACWLVRHGASSSQALDELKQLRNPYPELAREPAPQVTAQFELVQAWAARDPKRTPQIKPFVTSRSETMRPSIPSPANHANSSPLLIGVEPLSLHDRYLGAMFGLACGDAVGTTLEFKAPGSFTPIADMIGGGPFGSKQGSGLTILRWHCALRRASSTSANVMPKTRCAVTFLGGEKAILALQASALTLARRLPPRSLAS